MTIKVRDIIEGRSNQFLDININFDPKQVIYSGGSNKKNKTFVGDYVFNGIIYVENDMYYIEYIPLTSNTWHIAYKVTHETLDKFETERQERIPMGEKPSLTIFKEVESQFFNFFEHKIYENVELLRKKALPLIQNKDAATHIKQYLKTVK